MTDKSKPGPKNPWPEHEQERLCLRLPVAFITELKRQAKRCNVTAAVYLTTTCRSVPWEKREGEK